jgi:hypothetical protein
MVQKKGLKIFCITRDVTRDLLINRICKMYNFDYGLIIYTAITYNPIEMAISILALKLGMNKIVLSLIIAFIL